LKIFKSDAWPEAQRRVCPAIYFDATTQTRYTMGRIFRMNQAVAGQLNAEVGVESKPGLEIHRRKIFVELI
jgi:hypothetical protein